MTELDPVCLACRERNCEQCIIMRAQMIVDLEADETDEKRFSACLACGAPRHSNLACPACRAQRARIRDEVIERLVAGAVARQGGGEG